MKIIVFLLLVCLFVCCEEPGDRYVKRFDKVNIIKATIADSANNLYRVPILAKAQADNGCWSHLYFELKKTRDYEYSLTAYGTFESFGTCSDRLVTKDTVIYFLPKQTGTYLFHVSRQPGIVDTDTMIVVE